MPNYSLPVRSKFFKGEPYQQMQDDLQLAGMAQRTIHGYLRSVRQLADFGQCSPDQISEVQLRQWLLHLKVEKQFAYGSLRVAFSGVKFFFTRTCRRNWRTLAETKLQNIKTLPEVLTRRQVHQIIDACTTHRLAVYLRGRPSAAHQPKIPTSSRSTSQNCSQPSRADCQRPAPTCRQRNQIPTQPLTANGLLEQRT